jgi:hypothetical protein
MATEPAPATAPLPRPSRAGPALGCALVLAVLLLLRLPSLFEPAWSGDAGAYANIGRSLDLGGRLYDGIWDNKPPGMYWLGAAAMAGGASPLRMQLAMFAVVALATLLVGLLGWRLRDASTGIVAALLFAVVASLPNFAGDQLNAEIAGALPAAAAMLLLLWRTPIAVRRAAAAGLLLGAALLFKATFLADVLAALSVPVLNALAQRRRVQRADVAVWAAMIAGVAALCGAAAVAVAARGSLSALLDVLVHHDVRYAQWGQTAGPGGLPLGDFTATPSTLLRAVALSRLAAVIIVGAAIAVLLARRGRRGAAAVSFWLACDLAATMLDNRALTHYVQQAEPALALAAALAAVALWRRRRIPERALAVAALPAMWLALIAALFVPRAEAALATGNPLPPLTRENSSGRTLPSYYASALRLATGRMSLDRYHETFAGAVYPGDLAMAALLDAHSAAGQRVFVWGEASPWVYAYADRLPASRFIWMDSAYRLYPGGESLLLDDLRRTPPAALLAQQPLSPAAQQLLQHRGYTIAQHSPYGDVWVAPSGS